jgi:hypothetical protein
MKQEEQFKYIHACVHIYMYMYLYNTKINYFMCHEISKYILLYCHMEDGEKYWIKRVSNKIVTN